MELTMYAVFEDGSRQYMVSEGDVVNIDLRLEPIGNMLEITSVLLISNGAANLWLRVQRLLLKLWAKLTKKFVSKNSADARTTAGLKAIANTTPVLKLKLSLHSNLLRFKDLCKSPS
jgi:hypothetical protein